MTKKWWISYNHVRFKPLGFGAVLLQEGVSAFNVVQRFEDWILGDIETIPPHPLNFTDPD